jgi:hypothetical protein
MLVRRQRDVPRTNTPELQIRAEAQVECLRDSGGGVDAVINRREGVGPVAVIFAPVTLYFLIRSFYLWRVNNRHLSITCLLIIDSRRFWRSISIPKMLVQWFRKR